MTKAWAPGVVVVLAACAACSSWATRSGPPPEQVARAAAPAPDPEVGEGTGDVDVHVVDQVGQPLADATIVATSPALQGTSHDESDEAGWARLRLLPPGAYEVVLYYGPIKVNVAAVVVAGSATRIDFRIDTRAMSRYYETAAAPRDPG
jgi:hypothetical protein